jgi:hypothetical protein
VEETAMTTTTFVLVDHSDGGSAQDGSALTMSVLTDISAVIDNQLNGEFAAEWGGVFASRVGADDGSDVRHDQGEIEVAIFQNEDVSGAAGYHDRDPQGHAYIHVALDDASSLTGSDGLSLSVIISHECCETAADPGANRWADRNGTVSEALETCDRCEDVSYEIDGIAVSDFLLKSAFDPGSCAPWDHMNVLSSEDGQTSGGYVIKRQQGTETNASSDGLVIKIGRRVSTHHDASLATEAFKRRKNHPASRTSRRGARIS